MPTGLIRRGARYSIRRRIPLDLVPYYGKAECTEALGTADPKVARKRLPLRWAAFDREFEAVRARLAASPQPNSPDFAPPPKPSKAAPKKADPWATMSEAEWDYLMEADKFQREQDAREEFERDEREELERKILALADGPADGLTAEQLAIRDILRDRAYFRGLSPHDAGRLGHQACDHVPGALWRAAGSVEHNGHLIWAGRDGDHARRRRSL